MFLHCFKINFLKECSFCKITTVYSDQHYSTCKKTSFSLWNFEKAFKIVNYLSISWRLSTLNFHHSNGSVYTLYVYLWVYFGKTEHVAKEFYRKKSPNVSVKFS